MPAAAGAGALYFALVFAAGFVIGAVRTLLVAPRLGELAAVLIELPVMLAIAWVVCRWLVRRHAVPAALGPRLAMGVVAFVLLMAAELALALGLGRSIATYVQSYRTLTALIGLAGQIVFALLPAIQLHLERDPRHGRPLS